MRIWVETDLDGVEVGERLALRFGPWLPPATVVSVNGRRVELEIPAHLERIGTVVHGEITDLETETSGRLWLYDPA